MILVASIIVLLNIAISVSSIKANNITETIDLYSFLCGEDFKDGVFESFISCDHSTKSVVVLPSVCITYYPTRDNDSIQLFAGRCTFMYLINSTNEDFGFLLPEKVTKVSTFNEEVMCKEIHRSGTLCSECNNETGVALNSVYFNCVPIDNCHGYYWINFLASHLVPVTVLFFIILLFDIKLLSGYAFAFILIAQIFSSRLLSQAEEMGVSYVSNKETASQTILRSLMSLYSIWGLEFGSVLASNICVGQYISTIDAIALQYLPCYFSFFLCFVAYLFVFFHKRKNVLTIKICKFFSPCFRSPQRDPFLTVAGLFATFLLLSYSKLLATSLMLLSPTYLYNIKSEVVDTVYFYDGSVKYFRGTKTILLSVLAILTVLMFIILPVTLLMFYPIKCFRRCLQMLRLHTPCLIALVDSYQQCYRDGTNGARDCRWFSAVYFLFRIGAFLTYMLFRNIFFHTITITLCIQLVVVMVLLLVLYFSPYKVRVYNHLDITILVFSVFIISLEVVNLMFEESQAESSIVSEILLLICLIIPLIGAVLYIGYYTVVKATLFIRLSLKAWYSMRSNHERSNSYSCFQHQTFITDRHITSDDELNPLLSDRQSYPSEIEKDGCNLLKCDSIPSQPV